MEAKTSHGAEIRRSNRGVDIRRAPGARVGDEGEESTVGDIDLAGCGEARKRAGGAHDQNTFLDVGESGVGIGTGENDDAIRRLGDRHGTGDARGDCAVAQIIGSRVEHTIGDRAAFENDCGQILRGTAEIENARSGFPQGCGPQQGGGERAALGIVLRASEGAVGDGAAR